MSINQLTIKKKVEIEGLGLHSGLPVNLKIFPAAKDTGICFIRTDLKKSKPIYANWKNISPANLCTKICNDDGQSISTIEHLMFSFYALKITNLIIEINGPEVPIMDGSAKIFIDEIFTAGLIEQNKKINYINILKSFEINNSNKYIKYEPTNNNFLEVNYQLDYKDQLIKKQNFKLKNAQKNYSEVSSCRTFCHQEDLEKIFAMGLAKGGSLENAIVISGNKVLNQEGLRYKDEFVRHKILDFLGDFYLSGFFISGKITCRQGGHELTAALLKKIFQNNENFYTYSENNSINQVSKKNPLNISKIQAIV